MDKKKKKKKDIIHFVKSSLRRLCKSHYLNLIQLNNFFGNIILFVLTKKKENAKWKFSKMK